MPDEILPPGEPNDLDEVGYKHPPRKHRFKLGQSGNPKGRPKKAKSYLDSVETVLNRKLHLQTSDGPLTVPFFEALYLKMAQDALTNPVRAPMFIKMSVALRPDLFVPAIKPEDQKYGLITNGTLPIEQWEAKASTAQRPKYDDEPATLNPNGDKI